MTNDGVFSRTGLRALRSLAIVGALLCVAGVDDSARAQVLDDEIARLLSLNCDGLGFFSNPNDFGRELTTICANAQNTGNGSSSGGGAAAAQSSVNSVQNSVLQRRLERARAGRPESGEGGSAAAARDSIGVASWNDWSVLAMDSGSAGEGGGSGDFRSRRFDLFFSLGYEGLDRNVTVFEDGYSSTIGGATLGFDYRFVDWFVAGLIITYSRQEADFDGGGEFENSAFLPTLFATFLPSDRSYLNVSIGRNFQDFDVQRAASFVITPQAGPPGPTVTGTPISSTDPEVDLASLQFGYDFFAGSFTFGPRLAGYYSRTTIDPYSETSGNGLELRIGEQSVKSMQGTVGFFGAWAIGTERGVFLPQLNVEYVWEFEDEPVIIAAQFAQDNKTQPTTFTYQTNTPDSDFVNIDLGFSAVLANGISPYVTLRGMLGNDLFDSYAVYAGVRFEL